jgi:hypothetical protein
MAINAVRHDFGSGGLDLVREKARISVNRRIFLVVVIVSGSLFLVWLHFRDGLIVTFTL